MLSKLMLRILQLINPRAYVPSIEEKEEIAEAIEIVEAAGICKEILPRVEFSDAEGTWVAENIAAEIKIGMNGSVYFKIKGIWVEQQSITSVRFYR